MLEYRDQVFVEIQSVLFVYWKKGVADIVKDISSDNHRTTPHELPS